MAGRYAKYYSRRGTRGSRQPTPANILFDNIVEVTKRPSAAKSAGTVGRWGITSFTSLRSANGKHSLYFLKLIIYVQAFSSHYIHTLCLLMHSKK